MVAAHAAQATAPESAGPISLIHKPTAAMLRLFSASKLRPSGTWSRATDVTDDLGLGSERRVAPRKERACIRPEYRSFNERWSSSWQVLSP